MKQMIALLFTAISFTACNNADKTETTTSTNADTMELTPPTTTTTTTNVISDTVTNTRAYVPAEGDVVYRNGKVMVWRNNDYVESKEDITLNDGVIIRKNGEVKKDDKMMKLEEGESVTTTGKFFNKAGEGIEDAWDATKKGVGKAASAIKKAGNKVGEEVKDAVN